jgi:hypothetical protein
MSALGVEGGSIKSGVMKEIRFSFGGLFVLGAALAKEVAAWPLEPSARFYTLWDDVPDVRSVFCRAVFTANTHLPLSSLGNCCGFCSRESAARAQGLQTWLQRDL